MLASAIAVRCAAVFIVTFLFTCSVSAQQFSGEFNDGYVEGNPGNPAAMVWDIPYRAQGVFESSHSAGTEGSMTWNVGLTSPQSVALDVSGVWLQGVSWPNGYIRFRNKLSLTLAEQAGFTMSGSLSAAGGGRTVIIVEPLTGGILGVPTGPSGVLQFVAEGGVQSVQLAGTLQAGSYNIHTSVSVGGSTPQTASSSIRLAFATGACCAGTTCAVTLPTACIGNHRRFAGIGAVCNAAANTTTPCCRADFTQDGLRSPTDIFALLDAYFSTDAGTVALTDFDGSGTRQPADLFAFLNAYFAGGC